MAPPPVLTAGGDSTQAELGAGCHVMLCKMAARVLLDEQRNEISNRTRIKPSVSLTDRSINIRQRDPGKLLDQSALNLGQHRLLANLDHRPPGSMSSPIAVNQQNYEPQTAGEGSPLAHQVTAEVTR